MTKTLGLIGTGMIGGTLARLAVAAGLNVVLSNSRGPASLADLVAGLGDQARAATPVAAAEESDLVVATIPLAAYAQLPAAALAGATVIDTMNYYPERDGRIAELDAQALTSSAMVQRHLAESRVVKAFNNIGFYSLGPLARPSNAADRSALPIAGDDDAAKASATELLDAVDTGSLADSWRSEPGTPVYVQPYAPRPLPEGLAPQDALKWLADNSVPLSADRVRELIASAVRGPAGGSLPNRDA